jgi:hypothetical protein
LCNNCFFCIFHAQGGSFFFYLSDAAIAPSGQAIIDTKYPNASILCLDVANYSGIIQILGNCAGNASIAKEVSHDVPLFPREFRRNFCGMYLARF